MDLGAIAKALFNAGLSVFQMFSVSYGDITINGWSLLIGGAIVLIVANLLGRIYD